MVVGYTGLFQKQVTRVPGTQEIIVTTDVTTTGVMKDGAIAQRTGSFQHPKLRPTAWCLPLWG